MQWFRFQPTVWLEVVRQGGLLAMSMGWIVLEPNQQALALSFASAVLAALNWSLVMPTAQAPPNGR